MKDIIKNVSLLILLFFGFFVHSRELDVNLNTFSPVNSEETAGAAISSSNASEHTLDVEIRVTCSGSNLRETSNPISRYGVLVPKISISTVGLNPQLVVFHTYAPINNVDYNEHRSNVIPTWISSPPREAFNSGAINIPSTEVNNSTLTVCRGESLETCDPAATGTSGGAFRKFGSAYGIIKLKLVLNTDERLPDFWNSTSGYIEMPAVSISFEQRLIFPHYRYFEYFGYSGPLTNYTSSQIWDPSGRKLVVYANFPGEELYCGGYHSPLVLFFDSNHRPLYKSTARFDLASTGGAHFWPEASSNTYFLALDKNKNGRIDKANELFGNLDNSGVSDGFAALKKYDLNADTVIDSKDAVFAKLLLWKDTTGKGKCLKKDLYTLDQMKVKSISLKYKSQLRPFSGRAEEREEATFQFQKDGQEEVGTIIDVWLALSNERQKPISKSSTKLGKIKH